MSARVVFNPINLGEIARTRSPLTTTADQRRAALSGVRNGIGRVRKALFGPINHEETHRFLNEQLAKQSNNESEKWQFNFPKGVPMSPSGTRGRYAWKALTPPPITYAPNRRPQIVECDNDGLYAEPSLVVTTRTRVAAEVVTAAARKQQTTTTTVGAATSTTEVVTGTVVKKQPLITDFMQVRKRSADDAFVKKINANATSSTNHPSKLKISRTSSDHIGS